MPLYFCVPNDLNRLSVLHGCPHDIKKWIDQHFLQLNVDKTEVLIIVPVPIVETVLGFFI